MRPLSILRVRLQYRQWVDRVAVDPDLEVEVRAGGVPGAADARDEVAGSDPLPLVHQQLDAIATHQLAWQGQIWPGQTMEGEIEDPARDDNGSGNEPDTSWNTTLRLTLPSLGGVEARLHLTPAGIAIRLIADDSATRKTLQAAESRLADALAAANVPLTGMVAELRQAP